MVLIGTRDKGSSWMKADVAAMLDPRAEQINVPDGAI
jgi:hypothetical protein